MQDHLRWTLKSIVEHLFERHEYENGPRRAR